MKYLMLIVMVAISSAPAFAASNFLGGMSGMILTPDNVIIPHATGEASFHESVEAVNGENLNAWGLNYGVAQGLEAGLSVLSSGGRKDVAINGKYQMIRENESSPAVLVGVFDAAGLADTINGDASIYILASKNITSMVSQIGCPPANPFRLNLGVGSGVYNGVFGGVDWTASSRWRVMAEYTNGEFADERNLVNVGVRYAVADKWRLDAGLLKFKRFAFGVGFRTAFD